MKNVGQNLSKRDRIVIILLAIVILYFAYLYLVKKPMDERIANEKTEQDSIQTQLTEKSVVIAELEQKKAEMEKSGPDAVRMPSYNAEKEENNYVSTISRAFSSSLPHHQWEKSETDLKRTGDQIRRTFTCKFSTDDYDKVMWALQKFASSPTRCLLEDVKFTSGRSRSGWDGPEAEVYTVTLNATFYETMHGGEEDQALPKDSAATVN